MVVRLRTGFGNLPKRWPGAVTAVDMDATLAKEPLSVLAYQEVFVLTRQ